MSPEDKNRDRKPKKKIYIVDMYTNGHKAALQAIGMQGWSEDECQIIKCGSHQEIVAALKREHSFAVLPVHNSESGEVTQVTPHLRAAWEMGYRFRELQRFSLPIEHYLAAPHHVRHLSQIKRLYSHPQPFLQSKKFLERTFSIVPSDESIGTGEFYEKSNSTSEAAELVSRASADEFVGAVTTLDAATSFGLNILARRIEDSSNNQTTFVFLENEAKVECKTVGIIGVRGASGRMFENFFESKGCRVIGSDIAEPEGLSNETVVSMSDVVIVSVPIPDAAKVAEEIMPHVREDQLLIDVTSIKGPAMNAMLKGAAEVIGLHAMFRPGMPFAGQIMVVCPEGLQSDHWKSWLVNVLSAMQVHIEWSTAEEHDRFMSVVQVLVHISNLVSALTVTSTGVSARKSLSFASPIYKIALALIGRMIGQNPALYSAIIIHNPYTIDMLERRIAIEQRLLDIVQRKDQLAFEQLFAEASAKLGDVVIRYSNDLFERILSVVNILASPNSILLECPIAASKPGLLMRILNVFSGRSINFTGIDSLELGGRLQFAVRFEQSKDSEEVLDAIREIRGWEDVEMSIVPLDGLLA